MICSSWLPAATSSAHSPPLLTLVATSRFPLAMLALPPPPRMPPAKSPLPSPLAGGKAQSDVLPTKTASANTDKHSTEAIFSVIRLLDYTQGRSKLLLLSRPLNKPKGEGAPGRPTDILAFT